MKFDAVIFREYDIRGVFNEDFDTEFAFTLGRAYDALGDGPAARRSYLHALRTLDPNDRRHESLLQQVDLADIAAACRARLDEG